MAKKKELTFREILMKMERFLKDAYLVQGTYFIDGEESTRIGIGWVCGVLNPEAKEVIEKQYPGMTLNIKNIRNAKDQPNEFIDEVQFPMADIVKSKCKELYEGVRACTEWKEIPWTTDQIDALFNRAERVELEFSPDRPVQVSKSVFPTVTVKNASSVEYALKPRCYGDSLQEIWVRIPGDFYTVFIDYAFMYF